MNTIQFLGETLSLEGPFPKVGSKARDFHLAFSRRPGAEAPAVLGGWPKPRMVGLDDFHRRRKVLNIVPSIDTPVCAGSVHEFETHARQHPRDAMLMVSADLPFAMQRFCGDHSVKNVFPLSMVADRQFARDYGVLIKTDPWAGLCARACIVIDADNTILHAELVPELEQEPDYAAALAALGD